MFTDFFDQEKLKLHIRELTSMLRQPALADEELTKIIEVTKFSCMLDLIDLTQESTEKKLQMKEFKIPVPEIIALVSQELDLNTREDVYHANFLRALEFIVATARGSTSAEEIAAAEQYIGSITKQKLQPEDLQQKMAQAAASQTAPTTQVPIVPTAMTAPAAVTTTQLTSSIPVATPTAAPVAPVQQALDPIPVAAPVPQTAAIPPSVATAPTPVLAVPESTPVTSAGPTTLSQSSPI